MLTVGLFLAGEYEGGEWLVSDWGILGDHRVENSNVNNNYKPIKLVLYPRTTNTI